MIIVCLFEELKNNSSLGINRLDVLKEILTQAEEQELLEKVKEFEKRRILENKFERRKGVYIEVFIRYFFASLRVFFVPIIRSHFLMPAVFL